MAWSDEAREAWLEAYRRTFSKELASQESGIPYTTQRRWYAEDPEWAESVDSIREQIGDVIQAVLIERALHGVPQQVVSNGEPLFVKDEDGEMKLDEHGDPIPLVYRRHSDKLMIAAAENMAGWGQRDVHQVEVPRKEVILLDHEGNAMSLERLVKGHFKRAQKLLQSPTVEADVVKAQGNGKHKGNGKAKPARKKKRKKSE